MTTLVVDTNVAIVANGDCADCSPACRLSTIDFLERLIHKGSIAIDVQGKIEEEYRRHLCAGTPGVGSRFLQKFFSDAAHRIERVDISETERKFSFSGALRSFDQSDRKFVLVASEGKFEVVNAVDSDWLDHEAELLKRGIRVQFLCGKNRADWFTPRN